MRVRLRFIGTVAELAGCRNAEAELGVGAIMDDVMTWLDDRFGPALPVTFWDRQTKRFVQASQTLVFLDGKDLRDYRRPVQDGSEVICLSAVVGGSR